MSAWTGFHEEPASRALVIRPDVRDVEYHEALGADDFVVVTLAVGVGAEAFHLQAFPDTAPVRGSRVEELGLQGACILQIHEQRRPSSSSQVRSPTFIMPRLSSR